MSAPPAPVYTTDTTAVPPAGASHVNPGHLPGNTHSNVPAANAPGHVQAPLATAPQGTGLHAKLAQAQQAQGSHTAGVHSTTPNTVAQPVGPGGTAAHQTPLSTTTTSHTNAPVGGTTTTHPNAPLSSAAAGGVAAGAPPAQPMADRLAASGLPVLPAFQPPLGPQPHNDQFYSPQQITLTLTEKVWAIGDTFTVQTADGAHIMQVKGKGAYVSS